MLLKKLVGLLKEPNSHASVRRRMSRMHSIDRNVQNDKLNGHFAGECRQTLSATS